MWKCINRYVILFYFLEKFHKWFDTAGVVNRNKDLMKKKVFAKMWLFMRIFFNLIFLRLNSLQLP